MGLPNLLLLSLTLVLCSCYQVEGQNCRPYREFKCFWDGACIPLKMKCDGKHDCLNGEDETEWFAGCKNCSENEFHCHKDPEYLTCIDRDFTCDGMEDCYDGEDESYEFAKCKKKCQRDLAAAERAGRPNCRKPCKVNRDCRPKNCKRGEECYNKKCVCDHECGMSCVSITKTCPMLEKFPHLREIKYIQRNKKTHHIELAAEPFYYGVEAHHICEPGYDAEPSDVRICHGRGNQTWTREIICAKSCQAKKLSEEEEKQMCGMECRVDGDCEAGKICTCDGACGRTCVNLEVECGDAPPAENAHIEYTGENFDRVAHYICNDGFYIEEGDNTRKCTGSGKYDGVLIKCAAVECSDPRPSITAMGGSIISGSGPPYHYNDTVQFGCGSGQRLLGSRIRTCGPDGRWDGLMTLCDNIGSIERCPHPGVPIGGDLIGYGKDEDFKVGKWVEFKCNDGLVMLGQGQQECLVIKEWSDDGAPLCVDPRYSDSATSAIRKLSASAANVRAVEFSKAGRTIQMNSVGNIEVYFVIDLSLSVTEIALKNTIDFAQSLIRRLSSNDTTGRVGYGIVVFATLADVRLNIADEPKKTPEEVIALLGEIEADVGKIRRKKIKYGTDIHKALLLLDERMLAFSWENDIEDKIIKRHIFVITDGNFNAGAPPSQARRNIEFAYADNPPEFYSITSSAREKDPNTLRELQDIASKNENYVYVDDFYKLHQYVDKVTDVRIDYSPCGQAGEIGSIRKIVSRGRSIGGDDAADRAWPWQALITNYDENILESYSRLVGGGSLINDRWVLSATHLFDGKNVGKGWEVAFVVSLGISRRPRSYLTLQGSVKIFQAEKIYLHEDYNKLNGEYKEISFLNDVALIRLGAEFTISRDGRRLQMPEVPGPGSVDFTPYIRPVCLPCSPDSCVSKVLMKEDPEGNIPLEGIEDLEERCRIEYDFLIGKNKKGVVAVVATGFGHNASVTPQQEAMGFRSRGTQVLKQAVLRIEDRDKCQDAVEDITKKKGIEGVEHIFSDGMLCATGMREAHQGENVVDTCKGDSGGPFVRGVRDDATKETCFVQLGIVSWGYGCGHTTYKDGKLFYYPAFYTDVAKMMSWINETMNG